jgi:hypothetical protein
MLTKAWYTQWNQCLAAGGRRVVNGQPAPATAKQVNKQQVHAGTTVANTRSIAQ